MPIEKKYPYINWVNGMKISREHLLGLENSFIDHTRDATEIWLNNLNYGLLPVGDGKDPVLVDINPDRVEIRRCQAITRSGVRIDVPDNHNFAALRRPMHEVFSGSESNSREWYVIIKVNPFERLPFGQPNNEETPFRHPFAAPGYELSIVSREQLSSAYLDGHALPVAKISDINYGGKRADDQYIPPCTSVQAFGALMDYYNRFGDYTARIEDSLFEIIKKAQRKQNESPKNVLAADIETISTKIVDFFSLNKDSYDLLLAYQAPVYIVEWFSRMARIIKSTLRFLKQMDGMLKYFNIYIKGNMAVDFQKQVEGACTMQYDHANIQPSLQQIENFLLFLDDLFLRLKELKFEAFADPTIIDREVTNNPRTPVPQRSREGIIFKPKTPGGGGGGGEPRGGGGETIGAGLEDDD